MVSTPAHTYRWTDHQSRKQKHQGASLLSIFVLSVNVNQILGSLRPSMKVSGNVITIQVISECITKTILTLTPFSPTNTNNDTKPFCVKNDKMIIRRKYQIGLGQI